MGSMFPESVVVKLEALVRVALAQKGGVAAVGGLAAALAAVEGGEGVSRRLAVLTVPPEEAAGGSRWLAFQRARGRLSAGELWAADDIVRAHALLSSGGAALGLRAVDPSRLVVDGGPINAGGALGGCVVTSAEEGRWQAYVRDRQSLPARQRFLQTAAGPICRPDVVRRVLVDGAAPYRLSSDWRVQTRRVADIVVQELRRYRALHYTLA